MQEIDFAGIAVLIPTHRRNQLRMLLPRRVSQSQLRRRLSISNLPRRQRHRRPRLRRQAGRQALKRRRPVILPTWG
ncbi:MAG: hypothetical protein PHO01_08500 [Desulfotomaculaceae bacterium]|nr:hypothetical protein [Desulfotomaculaceae bacterium]